MSDQKKAVTTVSDLIDMWNKYCGNLPRVSKLTQTRKRKIVQRLKEEPDPKVWEKVFVRCATNGFLNGTENDRLWSASFDWIIGNDTNYVKVLEGRYDHPEKLKGKTLFNPYPT